MDILDYLYSIAEFVTTGIYDFVVETTSYWIQKATLFSLYMTYEMLVFSWDIAQDILADLNVTQTIDQAWSHLDSDSLNTANFFQIPQAVANLVTAYVTKFVFRFIGGSSVLA